MVSESDSSSSDSSVEDEDNVQEMNGRLPSPRMQLSSEATNLFGSDESMSFSYSSDDEFMPDLMAGPATEQPSSGDGMSHPGSFTLSVVRGRSSESVSCSDDEEETADKPEWSGPSCNELSLRNGFLGRPVSPSSPKKPPAVTADQKALLKARQRRFASQSDLRRKMSQDLPKAAAPSSVTPPTTMLSPTVTSPVLQQPTLLTSPMTPPSSVQQFKPHPSPNPAPPTVPIVSPGRPKQVAIIPRQRAKPGRREKPMKEKKRKPRMKSEKGKKEEGEPVKPLPFYALPPSQPTAEDLSDSALSDLDDHPPQATPASCSSPCSLSPLPSHSSSPHTPLPVRHLSPSPAPVAVQNLIQANDLFSTALDSDDSDNDQGPTHSIEQPVHNSPSPSGPMGHSPVPSPVSTLTTPIRTPPPTSSNPPITSSGDELARHQEAALVSGEDEGDRGMHGSGRLSTDPEPPSSPPLASLHAKKHKKRRRHVNHHSLSARGLLDSSPAGDKHKEKAERHHVASASERVDTCKALPSARHKHRQPSRPVRRNVIDSDSESEEESLLANGLAMNSAHEDSPPPALLAAAISNDREASASGLSNKKPHPPSVHNPSSSHGKSRKRESPGDETEKKEYPSKKRRLIDVDFTPAHRKTQASSPPRQKSVRHGHREKGSANSRMTKHSTHIETPASKEVEESSVKPSREDAVRMNSMDKSLSVSRLGPAAERTKTELGKTQPHTVVKNSKHLSAPPCVDWFSAQLETRAKQRQGPRKPIPSRPAAQDLKDKDTVLAAKFPQKRKVVSADISALDTHLHSHKGLKHPSGHTSQERLHRKHLT